MRPRTITARVSLAALLSAAPVLVLAGPAAAASPVTVADAYTVDEDTVLVGASVLTNDTDLDGDTLTAVLSSGPSSGTLVLDDDGTFTYEPAPNFNGSDGFTYVATDGTTTGDVATVTIDVTPVLDLIVANPDAYSTPSGTALVVSAPGLLANDTNPDGLPLAVASYADPAGFRGNTDGSFVYTPAPGFRGDELFHYLVADGAGDYSMASAVITVENAVPVAQADGYSVVKGATLTGASVLVNDSDVNGDPLSAVLDSGPSNGTLVLAAGGTFVYTPAPSFDGVDSFSYVVNDGTASSAPTTVTLQVVAATAAAAPAATAAPGPAAAGAGAATLPATGGDVSVLAFGALGMVGLGVLLVARSARLRDQA